MPAFFLHLAGAERMAARPDLPMEFAGAFGAEPGALRLGAGLPDLPYFDQFPLQVARHFFGHVSFGNPWGIIFHARQTGTLALSMLETFRRSHGWAAADADVQLALVGGYLCHHAFDVTIHPLVQAEVARDLRAGSREHPDALHGRCEKWQSLYFLEEQTGHDVMGSAYPRERVRSLPGAGGLRVRWPDSLLALVEGACLETHARAPGRALWDRWLAGARMYGLLLGSPAGRREGLARADRGLRERYYERDGFRLREYVDRAVELARRYLEAAAALLEVPVVDQAARARFLKVVPNVDIGVGA